MERFDRRLHVRVEQADIERAQALASALNITTSALVRLLLQLPAEDMAARRHVVLDLACATASTASSTSGATSRTRPPMP